MLPHNLQEFQGEDDSSVRMQCQWTDELPPLVTGKSQESHCFKNVRVLPTKYLVIIKEWVTQTTLTEVFKGFRCQNEFWKQKNLNFLWTHVLLTIDADYLKSENVFPPGYISILQQLELRIIGPSNITESNLWEKKYFYGWSQIATWCSTHEGKCLGCTMFHCRIMVLWHMHMTAQNCFLECRFDWTESRCVTWRICILWWCKCVRCQP